MSLLDCSQLQINSCYKLIGNYSDSNVTYIPNDTYLGVFCQIVADFACVEYTNYYYVFTHLDKIIELHDTFIKAHKIKFQKTHF